MFYHQPKPMRIEAVMAWDDHDRMPERTRAIRDLVDKNGLELKHPEKGYLVVQVTLAEYIDERQTIGDMTFYCPYFLEVFNVRRSWREEGTLFEFFVDREKRVVYCGSIFANEVDKTTRFSDNCPDFMRWIME